VGNYTVNFLYLFTRLIEKTAAVVAAFLASTLPCLHRYRRPIPVTDNFWPVIPVPFPLTGTDFFEHVFVQGEIPRIAITQEFAKKRKHCLFTGVAAQQLIQS